MLWSRINKAGALAGIIVGALTVLIWKQFEWFGLYEIIPGFILSGLAAIVVSLLTSEPSNAMQLTHEKYNQAFNEAS